MVASIYLRFINSDRRAFDFVGNYHRKAQLELFHGGPEFNL